LKSQIVISNHGRQARPVEGKWAANVSECAGRGSPWRPATALSGVAHPSQSGVAPDKSGLPPHSTLVLGAVQNPPMRITGESESRSKIQNQQS
jgi:hypothetical protein